MLLVISAAFASIAFAYNTDAVTNTVLNGSSRCSSGLIGCVRILSLTPVSGPIGTIATIRGTGFTRTGNKVKFGNLGIENNPNYNLNSSDGKTLVFKVPIGNYLACWAHGCMAPVQLTQPGIYKVSIINTNGMSNQVIFTVTK